jgi:hypothetical protein
MSRFNQIRNQVEPDQIYFDINVTNFQSASVKPQTFSYNESRTIAFINNPEEYYLTVERFSADTGSLPEFIPSIQPNQADRDLTIYSVSLSYDPADASPAQFNRQVYVRWRPQDSSAEIPLAPSFNSTKLQNNTTGYYNAYSYSYWVRLISEAFEECYSLLIADVNAEYPDTFDIDVVRAPVLAWDSSSLRAVLYANTNFYDLADTTIHPINIYFNQALYGLFSTFSARILGFGQDFGEDVRLTMIDQGGTNVQPLIPQQATPIPPAPYETYLAISIYQETSTVSSLTPITAFVITSNTLPIELHQVSTPIVLSDNINLIQKTNNSATSPIIADFVSDKGTYTPNILYTPTAQYKLITLYGNAPLHNIDLQLYYRLRDGSLTPFILQSGGSVTCKLVFLKKKANNTKFF